MASHERHHGTISAMAATDSPEIEARAADRVVVFSDAVVAIAITLLALELPSPNAGANASNLQVLRAS